MGARRVGDPRSVGRGSGSSLKGAQGDYGYRIPGKQRRMIADLSDEAFNA